MAVAMAVAMDIGITIIDTTITGLTDTIDTTITGLLTTTRVTVTMGDILITAVTMETGAGKKVAIGTRLATISHQAGPQKGPVLTLRYVCEAGAMSKSLNFIRNNQVKLFMIESRIKGEKNEV